MDKLEKVIQGLTMCQQGKNFCYDNCPYGENFPRCVNPLLSDTLELLKEQQSAYERGKKDGVSQYLREREEDEEYEY